MSGDPANPAPSLIPCLLFFFPLVLLPVAVLSAGSSTGDNGTGNLQCGPTVCGNVPIRYPWWIRQGPNASYCGYDNLGIDCYDEYPVLQLGRDNYRVDRVDYGARTIVLKDIDLLDSSCPRARHNLTLEESIPLRYTDADGFLLFFFNCSSGPAGGVELPCLLGSSDLRSYVFWGDRDPLFPWARSWWDYCWEWVMAPVLKAEIPSNLSSLHSSFPAILKQGFQLTWRQPERADCRSCERTGGKCGQIYNYDDGGYDFRCVCDNGTFSRNCSGTPESTVLYMPPNWMSAVCNTTRADPFEGLGEGKHA